MKENINYDFDEVMSYCSGQASTSVCDLATDLNRLSRELVDCEDKFHCKGGSKANAVMKIYQGFSTIIGSTPTKKGMAGLVNACATLVNTCYADAADDKRIVESMQY